MAAYGIHFKGYTVNTSFLNRNKSDQISYSNTFLPMSNLTRRIPPRLVSASYDSSNSAIIFPPSGDVLMGDSQKKDSNFSEKIDSWIQVSVTDIVKNLKQAPLLVQIYSENNRVGGNERLKIKTEKAILKEWSLLKSEWENEELKPPEALIFVEELENDCNQQSTNQDFEEGVTRAWGIVVQGKGMDSVPACYLLKTNKICAGFGLGFCTHFCLMKAINFRDSALRQFKDCWLLQ